MKITLYTLLLKLYLTHELKITAIRESLGYKSVKSFYESVPENSEIQGTREIQSPQKNCYKKPVELKVAPPIKNLLKI